MRNQLFEMALEWARSEDKAWRAAGWGFAVGAAGGKLKNWESEYVINVYFARMYRGISA